MELVQALAWLRTEVLNEVLLEFEEPILYWRGKEIARQKGLSDDHRLQHFFIQKGLGILEFNWIDQQKLHVGITNSLLAADHRNADKTIYLECGLVTEMLQQKYQTGAHGTAKWVVPEDGSPYIEITVILENPVI